MIASALLDRHRRLALETLGGAAGDRSLCDLSRDGSVPAVKYHEGAVAALTEVRRGAHVGVGGPEPDLRASVLTTRRSWATRTSTGIGTAGWLDYRAGGLAALDRLVAEVDGLAVGSDDGVGLGVGPGDGVGLGVGSDDGVGLGVGVGVGPGDAAVDDAGLPGPPATVVTLPTGAPGLVTLEPDPTLSLRELWPRRRVLTALVLTPPTAWFLFQNSGGWAPGAPLWTVLVVLVGAVAAAVVATYVPLPGNRGVDVGCGPCAAVAGVTALFAGGLLSSAPYDVGIAVVALGLVSFGLLQRQRGAQSCPAPRS
ncbi:MAG: hypothetical protein ACYC1Z_13530 [Georgenia sp.]